MIDQPVASDREQAIAVNGEGAARLFGLSDRHWRRLNSTGLCPAPIRIGSSVRWRVGELIQWSEQGCPTRSEWEKHRFNQPVHKSL